jgi:chemotaxis protein MotB
MAKKSEDKEPELAPIIIKKIQAGHGGAHGGAWKIALADMMTAMMAFFLLMWLLGATNESQRKSIADYFKPTPKSIVDLAKGSGSNGVFGGRSMLDDQGLPNAAMQTSIFDTATPPRMNATDKDESTEDAEGSGAGAGGQSAGKDQGAEQGGASGKNEGAEKAGGKAKTEAEKAAAAAAEQKQFSEVEQQLKAALANDPELAGLAANVSIKRDKDGLHIDLVDQANFSMFNLGTAKLLPRAQTLLKTVAKIVAKAPNKVAVRGHTDSFGFSDAKSRNNWTLSADRAETTRALLESSAVTPDRFARIEGVADSDPSVPANPYDPRNRRISVTLLTDSP